MTRLQLSEIALKRGLVWRILPPIARLAILFKLADSHAAAQFLPHTIGQKQHRAIEPQAIRSSDGAQHDMQHLIKPQRSQFEDFATDVLQHFKLLCRAMRLQRQVGVTDCHRRLVGYSFE